MVLLFQKRSKRLISKLISTIRPLFYCCKRYSSQSAQDFLSFVNASPSPFHAVHETKQRLLKAGFIELDEKNHWENQLKPMSKYFFTRNQSAIIAFAIGGKYLSGNGLAIVGAHTDSPCLKVKPKSKREKSGYVQLGVETYGGGLWHTWFDRDLGLAGRVFVHSDKGTIDSKLVNVRRPLLRIPTLAIHLDRGVSSEGFKFNNETQLCPILAESVAKELEKIGEDKHSPVLLNILAQELKVSADKIGDFELCLYDVNPSTLGGANQEYIFSARLDNLCMSYCGLEALMKATNDTSNLAENPNIVVLGLFDNEEVGSQTAHGADSNLLPVTVKRLASIRMGEQHVSDFEVCMLKSCLVSADMAHALHPNYSEKHEENHRPLMNKGVVIKHNANQRYATTSVTTTILREAAKRKNVPLQEFMVRNDSPCGSTIGPMLSAKMGLRTIDIGNPQLSMHSIREQCGAKDVEFAVDLLDSFYQNYHAIDESLTF